MTTTIYHPKGGIITADTRWSYNTQESNIPLSDGCHYLIYTDKSKFKKLSMRDRFVLMTAGNGKLIAKWKEWWLLRESFDNKPDTEINGKLAVNLMIVDTASSKILFHTEGFVTVPCRISGDLSAATSGSGGFHAASFLFEGNTCAKDAIRHASSLDMCTSDIVKYVNYTENDHNINYENFDYNEISKGIMENGYMMNLNDEKAIPIQKHPLAAEVQGLFTSGQAVASAPVPGLNKHDWTTEDDEKLELAMSFIESVEFKNN